jgi:hypothetical protein
MGHKLMVRYATLSDADRWKHAIVRKFGLNQQLIPGRQVTGFETKALRTDAALTASSAPGTPMHIVRPRMPAAQPSRCSARRASGEFAEHRLDWPALQQLSHALFQRLPIDAQRMLDHIKGSVDIGIGVGITDHEAGSQHATSQ